MKLTNSMNMWRRKKPEEHGSRWVGAHAGYDTTLLPRLTWKGFWMGILVSMGECS
jgi:SP family sugar:H+ symporter-like MFS transporter